MRKLLILFVIVCSFQKIHSQGIYLQLGKNFTSYDYKSGNDSNPNLQSGSGNFYETGYMMALADEKLKYAIGLSLNEYNAIGGDSVNSYSWNTEYLGIENTLGYSFVNTNGFDVAVKGGLGISTLIYGKQNLNGQYLNLSSQKEFSGLWLSPKLGLQVGYNVDNDIFLSFGYNYSKGFNVTNSTDEKLSFNTNQIQFGIHFTYY